MVPKQLIALILSLIGVVSCSIGRSKNDYCLQCQELKYELQIGYHVKGRGNIHTYSMSKYEYDGFDWIYLNKLTGEIVADSMIFTHYSGGTKYPDKQSDLKGHIKFLEDTTVLIDLQMPVYKDTCNKADHWENWEYNGKYKLKITNEVSSMPDENLLVSFASG